MPQEYRENSVAKNPEIKFLDRCGAPVFIDFFENGNSPHVSIAGVSGSGKTSLMKYIIKSYLSGGAKGWIIDIGRSYENFVHTNGGQFIDFRKNTPICINPFSLIKNIDVDIRFLVPWLASIAKSGSHEAHTSLEYALLEKAIRSCYAEHRELTTITHIQKYLIREASECCEKEVATPMSKKMMPFCQGGIYADFFNGPNTLSINANLVAIELEDLKNEPELLQAVLLILIYRATQEMYLSQTIKKIVVLDDIFSYYLGNQIESATCIEECYRLTRLYAGAFMASTQCISDYFRHEASSAIYANACWKLFLRQNNKAVKDINLGPTLEQMILSLESGQKEFREMVVYSSTRMELVRFPIEPYSNKPDNYNVAINRVVGSGMSF